MNASEIEAAKAEKERLQKEAAKAELERRQQVMAKEKEESDRAQARRERMRRKPMTPPLGTGLRKPIRKREDLNEKPTLRPLIGANGKTVYLPESYSKETPIQLQNPFLEDTSDRSLVEKSKNINRMNRPDRPPVQLKGGFDSEGYDHERGLQKELYYRSPCLTCSKCNTLLFIDAANARNYAANADYRAKNKLVFETLPKCGGCGSASDWWMGAHDLTKYIGATAKELEELLRRQKKAVVVIQRHYREHLRRCHLRAERQKALLEYMLKFRASSVIAAMVRGRLGRRRAVVQKAIIVIKDAHPVLLQRAISSRSEKKKVFWYKKEQLKVLFSDYLLVCERSGFIPPRIRVEENLREVAKRILEREAYLASRIQMRWRGIAVRSFMVIYRREFVRVREIQCAASLRLQCLFRGWVSRRRFETLITARHKKKMFSDYVRGRLQKASKDDRDHLKDQLRSRYRKERHEEKSARTTGLVHPGLAGGRKMKAFHESAYGYDSVINLMNEVAHKEVAVRMAKEKEDHDHSERGEFVRQRQGENRSLKLYYKDEMRDRAVALYERLQKEQPLRNAAKLLMHHNTKGIVYEYPDEVYKDPLAALDEGTEREGTNRRRKLSVAEQQELSKKRQKGRERRASRAQHKLERRLSEQMEADEKRQAKIAAFLGANSATAKADREKHHLDASGHGNHDLNHISQHTTEAGSEGGSDGVTQVTNIVITEADEMGEAD